VDDIFLMEKGKVKTKWWWVLAIGHGRCWVLAMGAGSSP
jgi:hypothetical protein